MGKQNQKKKNSMNRQQRREEERNPRHSSSSKPLGMRILIIAIFVVMLLGFVIFPLLK